MRLATLALLAILGLGILGQLLIEALLHFTHRGNVAPTNPELGMKQPQQSHQNGRNDAVSHSASVLQQA